MIKPVLKNPLTYLGFGLGLAAGIIAAGPVSFGPEDSARFLGAMVGSLITVSGAIALFFLKEEYDSRKRVEMVRTTLKDLLAMCMVGKDKATTSDPNTRSSVKPVVAQFRRAQALTAKFEFDDVRISEAHFWLNALSDNFDVDEIFDGDENLSEEERLQVCELFQNAAESALEKLNRKKSA
ncbi:hypothetical protein K3165_03195 [Qipengyuania sp. 1XM1-15A]|uniref:hypothetical protein n=1 Tax=Qipengyuania xiamenensis TaxID=2867237 RepID=UPI001C868830|nr:hypothetical protein [Qipengyuania xiamenensis]MBX7531928.1 hypothetical protein [Qipengyuania xiamenensis]